MLYDNLIFIIIIVFCFTNIVYFATLHQKNRSLTMFEN